MTRPLGQRRRETEAERLQRIQLEKARNAQLKISIPDEISVGELATRLKQNVAKVVAKFMQMGEMHSASDMVDFDSAALVAEEFHAKVEHEVHVSIEERLFTQEEDAAEDLRARRLARPPEPDERCVADERERVRERGHAADMARLARPGKPSYCPCA